MSGFNSRFIKPIHFVGDLLVINISFLLAYFYVFGSFSSFFAQHYLGLLLFHNIAWTGSVYLFKVYKIYRVTGLLSITIDIFRVLLFFFLVVEAYNGVMSQFAYSREHLLYSHLFTAFFIVCWRIFLTLSLRIYRKKGYNFRRVIIAGFGEASEDLCKLFYKKQEYGYRFLGGFDDKRDGPNIKGKIAEIEKFAIQNEVDEIYCSISDLSEEQLLKVIDFADKNFMRIKLLPNLFGLPFKKFKIDLYEFMPVIALRNIPLDDNANKVLKRMFDVFFSVFVCVTILSWLVPLMALIIKLDSQGPVFFKQQRSGLNNKLFWCLKFRTMCVNNEAHTMQATKNDTRITKIGKFMRKHNLDEMPQFINVLKGEMSVIGPRPHMVKHTEEYSQIIDKYMVRHFIKPGITGLSQVMGLRGETTDSDLMKKRVSVDTFYIENWTFWMDMKIILKTVFKSVFGDKKAF